MSTAMRSCDCSCKQIPNLLMHFTCLLSGGSFASSDEVMPTKQAKHYCAKALLRIGLDGSKHIWLTLHLL